MIKDYLMGRTYMTMYMHACDQLARIDVSYYTHLGGSRGSSGSWFCSGSILGRAWWPPSMSASLQDWSLNIWFQY